MSVAALIPVEDAQEITMTPDIDRSELGGIAVGIPSTGTKNGSNDTYTIAFVVEHQNHTKCGLYKRLIAEILQLCRGKKAASEINILSSLAGFNSLLELAHEWNLKFGTIQRSTITVKDVVGVEEIKTYNPSYKRMLKLENRSFRSNS